VSKKLKDIGIISFLTVISRFLGVARDALVLFFFGTGALASAFYTANTVPNLFRRLLAEGSLTAAFVPTLQEEMHANGRRGVFTLLSQVACWLLLLTGSLTVLAMLVCSRSRLLAGHDPKWYLTADLTVILFPYLALISLCAAFSATLNVLQRFFEPALSPIWLNLAMIGSMAGAGLHFAHSPLGQMHWLCGGVLLGGFLQMTVPAVVLMVEGWRPRWDLAWSPRVQEIARLMTPGLFGTAIYQVNIAVGRLLAFTVSDSGVTELYSANRLMELPIGVFAIAVSTVVYPMIAKHAAVGDRKALAGDFIKGLRMILMINIPAAVGLALLSRPIMRELFEHGKVHDAAAREMALLLALFAVGLPFFSIVNLTVRAFYSIKDIGTPVRIAAIDFVINVALSRRLEPDPDSLARGARPRRGEHDRHHRPVFSVSPGPAPAPARRAIGRTGAERRQDSGGHRGDGAPHLGGVVRTKPPVPHRADGRPLGIVRPDTLGRGRLFRPVVRVADRGPRGIRHIAAAPLGSRLGKVTRNRLFARF
jgi:putative peptidoglycan lipid II flippase